MKRLIIADPHGRNPLRLIDSQGIENIVCLGDIESPEIMEFLLNRGENNTLVVPGNHDFPYMVDCCKLIRGTNVDKNNKVDYLPCNEETYWKDVEKWANTPTLRNYAQKIIGDYENDFRFQKTFETKNGQVVCVHASIFDDEDLRDFEALGIEDLPYQLWKRMRNAIGQRNSAIITGNFDELLNFHKIAWMLFRGHDWGQTLYSIEREGSIARYETMGDPTKKQINFKLSTDKIYIVSFGSYKQGQYGIFDDEDLNLEFHNPERKDAWGE